MAEQIPSQTFQPAPQAQEPQLQLPDNDERIFAIIGYIAFLFVVPIIAKPKSKFCQLHAKQSMVMFLITIIVLVVLAAVPIIGSLLTLAVFALYILAIYRSFRGDYWKIPFISVFSEKIDLQILYGKAGVSLTGISGLKEKVSGMGTAVSKGVEKLGKQEEKPKEETQPPAPQ